MNWISRRGAEAQRVCVLGLVVLAEMASMCLADMGTPLGSLFPEDRVLVSGDAESMSNRWTAAVSNEINSRIALGIAQSNAIDTIMAPTNIFPMVVSQWVVIEDAGGSNPDAWGVYHYNDTEYGSYGNALGWHGNKWMLGDPYEISGYGGHEWPLVPLSATPSLWRGGEVYGGENLAWGDVWATLLTITNRPAAFAGNLAPGFRMLQDLDMAGYSIKNIGQNSLSFSNGVTISANDLGLNVNGSPAVTRTNLVASQSLELSYPVFCLPIGDSWVDYILKASTNNFTNICYYVRSTATNTYTTDTNVWAYFTDDYATDIRAWHYSPPGVSIYSQLANPTYSRVSFVMVYPSHDAIGWTNWMSSTNGNLIWSYARCDAISIEMNQTGNKEHWNPCVPVSWQSQRTRP